MKVETMLKYILKRVVITPFDQLKGVAYFTDSQYDIMFWLYIDGNWKSCYSLVAEGSAEEANLFQNLDEVARLLRNHKVVTPAQLTEVTFEQLGESKDSEAVGLLTMRVTNLPHTSMITEAKKRWKQKHLQ